MSPVCECGIPYVVIAKVRYSRHDLLGKHWAYMRSKGKIKPRKVGSVERRSDSALMEALVVNFGKEKAKAMAPTLKGATVEDKMRDALTRNWDG